MADKTKRNIAGVDLGTTFSALAILNAIGKPEVVANAEGERLTPSAIFFDEEDSNLARVGIEALNSRHMNVDRSVRWIKRHMGDTDYSKKIDGKDWSPVELSSLILKKLAQECSSEHGNVSDVVISVPAHFDEVRRKATMDAGALAGLNVIGIVNEPVAAALYYATTIEVSGKILVYDLGGGTFDVTIMNANGQEIDIVCSQGEHALGGVDFDRKILEMMENAYKEKFDSELIETDEERAKYEDEAEDIKKTLSRRKVARVMLYGPAGSMRLEIKREDFEEAISSLVGRTDMLIETALGEAKLKPEDIDKVILAGGSSRIPLVQKRLEEIFGYVPESIVNVDECVALGAALHAGLTMQRENPDKLDASITNSLKDIKLTDVCNHSYGTICAPIDKETGKHVIKNHLILKKNTPLPCEVTETFYTMTEGQTELLINVTQGEGESPEYVNKIATHTLELPPDRAAKCPIKVTYGYDLNQRMHCKFEDVQSNEVFEIDLSIEEDAGTSKEDLLEHAKELEALTVE
ncbi:MAG: Hsp70 family protein [Planctomycetes bacterium]|nr:Hsp70 family protein [Planctomycetota bacterium]